jgi:hypothetical protein
VKTYKNLFPEIVSFENLLLAARKAQRGKRFKQATAHFNLNLEKEILRLQLEIKSGLMHDLLTGRVRVKVTETDGKDAAA